jgi:phosphoesterase RecJ-like protein
MTSKEIQLKGEKVGQVIQNNQKILIICHKNPDGDTMGSALALYDHLTQLGKKVDLFCTDPFPEDFYFLPHFEKLKRGFDLADYDLAFTLDCGAHYMTGIHEQLPELFYSQFPLVNIDHHASNDNFGRWNLVDTDASSTTLILAELFQQLGIKISYKMATALLCGIFTDTGSFQHANTDPRSLRAASLLLRKGANLALISQKIFKTYQLSVLRLWGLILARVYQEDGVTISYVKDNDFQETNTTPADLSGVVDFLNSVPGSRYSILLTENDGKVKGSFRTLENDIDVAKIASQFGGGGHKKAAGFTVPGRLKQETRWKIVQPA